MFDSIDILLQQRNTLHHINQGITICSVGDQHKGVDLVKKLVYTVVDRKTALYLSGGRTPKELYELLAKDELMFPGAVGMVDERYGEKLHERSNERMMKETGLLRYFELRNIPFYPILGHPEFISGSNKEKDEMLKQVQHDKRRRLTAEAYDEKVRSLNVTFQKSVAILGIGSDGHTAGIAGNRKDFYNPLFDKVRQHLMVSEFNDEKSIFKERITMTFLGLSMVDLLVVMVFGDDKKEALELMFIDGSEEEMPSRFYKRPEIAKKTIIITDQAI